MKIYFARHAESQANLLHIISNRDLPHGLTKVGREQAAQLAGRLQGHYISCIYTSPVPRAVETSEIIARRLKVAYEPAEGLREFDCGVAEGRSDAVAWKMWQDEYDAWTSMGDYDYRIEGGESFNDIRQRFTGFIQGIIEKYSATSSEFVCISHGGIYRLMLPLVLGNVDPAMMSKFGFDYTSCITAELREEGLVCVEWEGNRI